MTNVRHIRDYWAEGYRSALAGHDYDNPYDDELMSYPHEQFWEGYSAGAETREEERELRHG